MRRSSTTSQLAFVAATAILATCGCDDAPPPNGGGNGAPGAAGGAGNVNAPNGVANVPGGQNVGQGGAIGGVDVYAIANAAPAVSGRSREPQDKRSKVERETWAARRQAVPFGDLLAARRITLGAAPLRSVSVVDPAEPRTLSISDTSIREEDDVVQILFSAGSPPRAVLNSLENGTTLRSYEIGSSTGPIAEVRYPAGLEILDVSPDGDLVFGRSLDGNENLDLCEGQSTVCLQSLSGASPLVEWKLDGTARAIDGLILDAGRVVTFDDQGRLVLWNATTRRAEYVVQTMAKGDLIITPGRRYVGALEPSRIAFLDAATGEHFMQIDIGEGAGGELVSSVFDEAGERLMVHHRNPSDQLARWHVGTGVLEWSVPVPKVETDVLHLASGPYALVGDTVVVTDVGGVIAKYKKSYSLEAHAKSSPDRNHWVVRRNPNRGSDGSRYVLSPIPVPPQSEVAVLASKPTMPPPVVAPGSTVSLQFDIGSPPDRDKFLRSIAGKIGGRLRGNGIGVAPNQPVTLVVSASQSGTGRTMEYEPFGRGRGGTITANVYESRSKIAFVRNGVELWSDEDTFANDQTFIAFPKTLRDGETMDQVHIEEVWRRAQIDIEMFDLPSVVYETDPATAMTELEYVTRTSRLGSLSETSKMYDAPRYTRAAFLDTKLAGVRDLEVADNDSESIAVVGTDGRIQIWSPSTLKGQTVVTHDAAIECAAFDDTGKLLVYGTADGAVQIYESGRRRHARRIKDVGDRVTAVALPEAGGPLYAGTFGGKLLCWRDWRKSLESETVAELGSPIVDLVVTPDGSTLVAGRHEGPFALFDPKTAEAKGEFAVPTGPVLGFHFNSAGTRVALATMKDGAVVVEYPAGTLVRRFFAGDRVSAVRFDNDGERLAVGGRSPGVWNIETGEPEYSLRSLFGREMSAIRYSRDGFGIATASVGRDDVELFNLRKPPIPKDPPKTESTTIGP